MHKFSSIFIKCWLVSLWLVCSPPIVFGTEKQECDLEMQESTPLSRFKFNETDWQIFDSLTNLTWKRCSEGQVYDTKKCDGAAITLTWNDAFGRFGTSGESWRLLNIDELESLIENKCKFPAANLILFPNIPLYWFWSSTKDSIDNDSAWYVGFSNASIGTYSRISKNAIRLVRGNPWKNDKKINTSVKINEKQLVATSQSVEKDEKAHRELAERDENLLNYFDSIEKEYKQRSDSGIRQALSANIVPDEKRAKKAALGIYLGIDTLENIRKKTNYFVNDPCIGSSDREICNKKLNKPILIGAYGQEVSLHDIDLPENAIQSAKFFIEGNFIEGIFLNGIIIEARVINSSEVDRLNARDAAKLRKFFDSKYMRTISTKKTENSLGIRFSYLHENWKEKNDSFTVELVEMRPYVINVSACMTLAQLLGDSTQGIERRAQCSLAIRNVPEYNLTYRDDKLFMPLLGNLQKAYKKKELDKIKSENDRLNRY